MSGNTSETFGRITGISGEGTTSVKAGWVIFGYGALYMLLMGWLASWWAVPTIRQTGLEGLPGTAFIFFWQLAAPVGALLVAIGAVLSVATAIILGVIGAEFTGSAEQAFEGFTMLFAAAVLTWMIFWMQKQGRQIQKGLEADVREALSGGQTVALFSVAFVAVLREGSELALFLTAVNFSSPTVGGEAPIMGWLGGLLGLLGAIIIGWLTFESSLRLNMRRFFQFTSVVLVFFAAGLVGHAIGEFNELGWIVSIAAAPNKGGTVTVNADGKVSYTPKLKFRGKETFRCTVRDQAGALSNTATVTVSVQ